MLCPVCPQQSLQMSERSGIEIDYCPQCRGVWLDRGELDKIIERSAAPVAAAPAPRAATPPPPPQYVEVRHGDTRHLGQRGQQMPHYRKKKKESFLSDLFDF